MNEGKILSKQQALFIASIGHDLRSPLNGILGTNELLLSTVLTSEQREYLKMQKRSSEMMLYYVENLLNYIKIERGQFLIEKAPIDLASILTSVFDSFFFQAKANNNHLHLLIDPQIPKTLIGDKVKITQIVSNILGNAVKFTSDGDVNLSLSLIRHTKKKVYVKIEVADTGKGMTVDEVKDVFEPFVQGEDSAKNYGGFGLGLYTAKALVTKLHGKIEVTSQPSKGTTFLVELPFAIPGELEAHEESLQTLIANELIPDEIYQCPYKILYADDSIDNHLLIRAFLKDTPLLIDSVYDGKQALESLKNNTYDLLLFDIQMPEMNGVEAIRAIREDCKHVKTPAIAFTANSFKEQIQEYYAAGFTSYICKPVKRQSLKSVIYRTLSYAENMRDK